MDKNKLLLSVSILLGCIILGGFYYASQISKQRSIEKQQQIELQAKAEQDKLKVEQDKKEYITKRKSECYAYFEKERKQWNNTDGFEYNEENDECIIIYNSSQKKTDEECKAMKPSEELNDFKSSFIRGLWRDYFYCFNGKFSKVF